MAYGLNIAHLDLPFNLSVKVHDVVPARDLLHTTGQRSQVYRHKTKHSVCQLVWKELEHKLAECHKS